MIDDKRCLKIYKDYLEIANTNFDKLAQSLVITFAFPIEDNSNFESQIRVEISNEDGSIPEFKVLKITKISPKKLQIDFEI